MLAPKVGPASFISKCFGSSACLQSSSSVLCKTAYGLESPQDRLGSTHAEGAGHPDKLIVHSQASVHMDGDLGFSLSRQSVVTCLVIYAVSNCYIL